MNQLGIIIKNEYLTDVKSKSFWIGTFILPILMIAFGVFIGFMAEESDIMKETANPALSSSDMDNMTGMQILGLFSGIMLSLFLMIYGSQIYNKVKKEKCNRIVEVLATCVSGRTMMFAKIISVALVGFTQLILWALLICSGAIAIIFIFNVDIPWNELPTMKLIVAFFWMICFFIGGYVFYGSIYAACGAITDKDNENQSYMTVITFLLLGSFYIGEFAASHPSNAFVTFCSFFPFTSPIIGAVNAIANTVPWYQSVLSLLSLAGFAALSVIFSGKLYTSSILLKGKNFTPKDIVTFLRMK